MSSTEEVVRNAVRIIRERTPIVPKLTLVLGSGLNALADTTEDAVAIDTSDIPGYPKSTVEGHRGRLVLGSLAGIPVLFVQGRLHAYEGHDLETVVLPIRVAHALGATHVLITNAAGGIRRDFPPGTLMWIVDHIDWVRRAPFRPELPGRPGAWARPEVSPWDASWQLETARAATAAGIPTVSGTYLWTLGPSFETHAEIRAFAGLGADAVGMSTVPEALAACELGLKVLGLSTITNAAAGLTGDPLNHEEVLDTGRKVQDRLEHLVRIVAGTLA